MPVCGVQLESKRREPTQVRRWTPHPPAGALVLRKTDNTVLRACVQEKSMLVIEITGRNFF
jgi:hypothetical protein